MSIESNHRVADALLAILFLLCLWAAVEILSGS